MNWNWSVVGVISMTLAIVGAVTYLASQSIISGADTFTLFMAILTGLGVVGGAHVTNAVVNNQRPALKNNNVLQDGTRI